MIKARKSVRSLRARLCLIARSFASTHPVVAAPGEEEFCRRFQREEEEMGVEVGGLSPVR